jgi:hypothetical protein
MTLKLGIASIALAVIVGCAVFAMKDQVQRLEGDLQGLRAAVHDEQMAGGRLKPAWAISNPPGRIGRLAPAHVGLQPAQPGQNTRIDYLPLRTEMELDSRRLQVVLPSGGPASLRLKPRPRLMNHPGLSPPQ